MSRTRAALVALSFISVVVFVLPAALWLGHGTRWGEIIFNTAIMAVLFFVAMPLQSPLLGTACSDRRLMSVRSEGLDSRQR
jgi:hypothetical protein